MASGLSGDQGVFPDGVVVSDSPEGLPLAVVAMELNQVTDRFHDLTPSTPKALNDAEAGDVNQLSTQFNDANGGDKDKVVPLS